MSGRILDFSASLRRRPRSVLACLYDGVRFRADIVTRKGGIAETVATAESSSVEPNAALAEALSRLSAQNHTLPKEACLVTPQVSVALLDLPVDPDRRRPHAQMQELVRWEMEAVAGQQAAFARIGRLLEGRGYMTAEQRADIVAEQAAAAAERGGKRARFGDLAFEAGYVTREQIDECLRIQETLLVIDDDVASAWVPQRIADEDGVERTAWYAASVARTVRLTWDDAFRGNGLALRGLYPVSGTLLATLESPSGEEGEKLLIELFDGGVVVTRADGPTVTDMRAEPEPPAPVEDALAAIVQEEGLDPAADIWLSARDETLAGRLSDTLGRAVDRVPDGIDAVGGAAVHALGAGAETLAVAVESRDPPPPIWRNADVVRVAVAVVVVLFLVLTEGFLQYRITSAKTHLATLETQFDEQIRMNRQLKAVLRESQSFETRVADLRSQVEAVDEELAKVEQVLIWRQQLVPDVLRALRESVNNEVVLSDISETATGSGVFNVSGWALRDTSAQLFINRLDKVLGNVNMMVTDESVAGGTGPLDLSGYKVDLTIVPRTSERRMQKAADRAPRPAAPARNNRNKTSQPANRKAR